MNFESGCRLVSGLETDESSNDAHTSVAFRSKSPNTRRLETLEKVSRVERARRASRSRLLGRVSPQRAKRGLWRLSEHPRIRPEQTPDHICADEASRGEEMLPPSWRERERAIAKGRGGSHSALWIPPQRAPHQRYRDMCLGFFLFQSGFSFEGPGPWLVIQKHHHGVFWQQDCARVPSSVPNRWERKSQSIFDTTPVTSNSSQDTTPTTSNSWKSSKTVPSDARGAFFRRLVSKVVSGTIRTIEWSNNAQRFVALQSTLHRHKAQTPVSTTQTPTRILNRKDADKSACHKERGSLGFYIFSSLLIFFLVTFLFF